MLECIQLLRQREQTVGFAESCTGGVLSAIFARAPGVSDIFVGAIVAYSNSLKERLLGVPSPLLRSVGAVSLPVARKMASGARLTLQSTWAISVTGIAGPSGGTPVKPVGTVCFAIVGPGVEEVVQKRFDGSRREIQLAAAKFALKLLRHALMKGGFAQVSSKTQNSSVGRGVAKRNSRAKA